jgi:hypothetical protein
MANHSRHTTEITTMRIVATALLTEKELGGLEVVAFVI